MKVKNENKITGLILEPDVPFKPTRKLFSSPKKDGNYRKTAA